MRQGVLFSIIVSIVFCTPVLAYDWSTNPGDGSSGNPYQISTPEQLIAIEYLSTGGVHFVLVNDIVFDPNNNPVHIFEEPVLLSFYGILNGNGYTIYNFTIVLDDHGFEVGFIKFQFGIVENINFKNADITIGDYSADVGILCGKNEGLIENCSASGHITLDRTCERVGGLMGENSGHVWDCKSTVSIRDGGYSNDIGGLIGYNEGEIESCEASGSIDSNGNKVGGLVGTHNSGGIQDCHTTSGVYGGHRIGGLVGENNSLIYESSAEGNVIGYGGGGGGYYGLADISVAGNFSSFNEAFGGGFVGYNSGTIETSLSRASVLGLEYLGGFAGVNEGIISNCYSTGSVTAPPPNEPGDVYHARGFGGFSSLNFGMIENSYSAGNISAEEFIFVGGSIAGNAGTVENCFWDVDLQTHGVTESIGINDGGEIVNTVGLPTVLMQQGNTFIDAGWDFVGETSNGWFDIWWIDEAIDYPRLWFEKNIPPVANAGADQRVFAFGGGSVDVQLDGTGSSDGDGDPLEYVWFNDANELIAEGAEPSVVLPVGVHVIDLIVNDGTEDSQPDSCVVTVLEAIEVEAELTPGVLNRDSGRPHVIGRIEFAGEAMPVLDPNEPMVLLAGEAQLEDQRQILDYSKKEDTWYLAGFFDNAAVMEAIIEDGDIPITLAARLLSGQWMFGTDIVTVK
ncbi:MAG: GLUG motif-containing protein [Planctomycetota bacterium]|jgi:hypothetical protein